MWVLEEGQKILPDPEKAIVRRIADQRQTEGLLVEIPGSLHISYRYGDMVKCHNFKRGSRGCGCSESREALDQVSPTELAGFVAFEHLREDLFDERPSGVKTLARIISLWMPRVQ